MIVTGNGELTACQIKRKARVSDDLKIMKNTGMKTHKLLYQAIKQVFAKY
jgi:hypothetical protein